MGVTAGLHRSRLAGAVLFVCMACATRPELGQPPDATPEVLAETERLLDRALDHWIERSTRVQRISQRVRLAGRELCGDRLSPILGLSVIDARDPPPHLAYPSWKRFGAERGVHVVAVFPDTPAERAGVREGDVILSVDGRLVGSRSVDSPRTPAGEPTQLEIERDGQALTLAVDHVAGCLYPVSLAWRGTVNAWADGKSVGIDSSLARVLSDDSFLAYVVGHELAHNIELDAGVSSLRDRGRDRLDSESRADYIGIYLAVRAGYPLRADADVYMAMIQDVNQLGARASSHPTTHARTLAFRKTLEEIVRKRAAGEPLVPTSR